MGKIRYLKVSDNNRAASYIAGRILNQLDTGRKVLWLIPGGSAMEVAVLALRLISAKNYSGSLTVTLTDERYGPPDHQDSNWRQLKEKGIRPETAQMLPVLNGYDLITEARNYSSTLNKELGLADYSFALGGMGTDGHIFGIKPQSPAVDNQDDVCGYEWDDYQRLTPTAVFFSRIDEIIMYVMGSEKHGQLQKLDSEIEPFNQPAQLLKRFKNVVIMNDWKGNNV
jgi:6-phosphogluconolactonase/glucosamine-6-phosphate isomerase/deaminase